MLLINKKTIIKEMIKMVVTPTSSTFEVEKLQTFGPNWNGIPSCMSTEYLDPTNY